MADNLTPFDPSAAAGPPDVAKPGLRGFMSSKSGKLIIGVAAVVVVAGVLAVIGLGFMGSGGSDDLATQPMSGSGGASVTKPAVAIVATSVPDAVQLDDVFTYRDVFVPTVVLVSSTTTGTSTTSTSNSSSGSSATNSNENVPEDTLVLEDITTEDGEPVAVLTWNGSTYTLQEGESIPNTPWKVLEINSSTVVMLYGDQRITLSVGVGVTK
jgi:type IV pilus biogenesis protein PilP